MMICRMVVIALGANQLDRALGIELWGCEAFGLRIDERWLRSPRKCGVKICSEYCTFCLGGDVDRVYIGMYSSCTSLEGVRFSIVVEENEWIRDMYSVRWLQIVI